MIVPPVVRAMIRHYGALSNRSILLHPDRLHAAPAHAQRHRTVRIVAPPHRQRAARPHLIDQALAQQLGGKLLSRTAPQLWRQRDAAIFALRGSGQNDQLSLAELHRILRSASDGNHPPSPPEPRKWRKIAGGAGSGLTPSPSTDAPFAA